MSKLTKSHARTQNGNPQPKRTWCGQDNLKLRVDTFFTLCKWLDVDECHHPVKDYIAALKKLLWETVFTTSNLQECRLVKELVDDLVLLDSNIDKIMEKGGER